MHFDPLSPLFLGCAAVALLLLILALVLNVRKRRRASAGLRTRFGPEYDRAVITHGSERKAEATLADREARVGGMKLRELSATERERFTADWQAVQSRFVDHPRGSVTEADELISAILVARGYPVADFDRRAADVSVHHPRLVEHYRTAHGAIVRLGKEEASTEDLRNAMIQYRSLFEELLETHPADGIRIVA